MQFGLRWLSQWVQPLPDATTLERELPQRGFEVASLQSVGEMFSGVITAEVTHANPHPNADRLRVCQVTDGTASYDIVCGAPNARAGIKVALAKPGAVLPQDFVIKASTIRGVESNGMLCSERELGLGEDHDGIIELPADTPLGKDFRQHAELDEQVIELEITPNRGDCLSVLGMAREVSALFDLPLTQLSCQAPAVTLPDSRAITLSAPEACPAYYGRVVRVAQPPQASPQWMQRCIERAGLRPINLWVDVTNYVMLELGQPLHAFDNTQLNGDIEVCFAQEGTEATLLNDQTIALHKHHLIIRDADGPIALGGVMGCASSAVDDTTVEVFLEAAHFTSTAVAGRARELKLSSDACFRFERGVDPTLPERALARASALLVEIAKAELGPVCHSVDMQHLPQPPSIVLNPQRMSALAGVPLSQDFMRSTLQSLGFVCDESQDDNWLVTPPPYRLDVEGSHDLLEEILRTFGLSSLPDTLPHVAPRVLDTLENQAPQTRLEDHLVALGYQEVMSYSFISREAALQFGFTNPLVLANPLTEMHAVMRPSMLPSLLAVLDHNRRHQHRDIKIFETGLVYSDDQGTIRQYKKVGMAAMGASKPLHWHHSTSPIDFFEFKGELESLFGLFGAVERLTFVPLTNHPGLHPGRSAQLVQDDRVIGVVGELHPELCRSYDMGDVRPLLGEITLQSVLHSLLPQFRPLLRFPGIARDFAFELSRDIAYADIQKVIRNAAGPLLQSITPFDIYAGQNHNNGQTSQHSVAVRLYWESSKKTLSDAQVNYFANAVVEAMSKQFSALQR